MQVYLCSEPGTGADTYNGYYAVFLLNDCIAGKQMEDS